MQRWLKFVKYLPQLGWMPTVITTKDGDYPAIDESLLAEVPANVKVIRTKTPTFSRLFRKTGKQSVPYGSLETTVDDSLFKKIAIWVRLNLIIPDARKVWNKYALQAATNELRINKYDAVITSGPPHSTHLIGLILKRKLAIKWLADFRDPWTKINYLEKVNRLTVTRKLDKNLERKVVVGSDLIISINKIIINGLNAANKGFVIPNGFDPSDFAGIQKERSDKFEINYFGNITRERNPAIILKAINQINAVQLEIQVNFWGNISDGVKEILLKLDKNKIINFYDYIPHDEMLQKMKNSSLLLLLINNVPNNRGILTGKIYEYLGTEVPILGIGPIDGEATAILQETKAGKMFDYEDQINIAEFILEKYRIWQKGKTVSISTDINKFSRKEQAVELTEILNNLQL